MKYSRSESSQNQIARLVKSIVTGVLIGSIMCSILLCAFAFVFVGIRSIPAQAVFLFSLTSAVIGAFLGSYVAVRINKEKGMICGMSIGFGIFFILLLVSVSVASEPFTLVSLIKLFSMMLSGAVGGIIGVNKRR